MRQRAAIKWAGINTGRVNRGKLRAGVWVGVDVRLGRCKSPRTCGEWVESDKDWKVQLKYTDKVRKQRLKAGAVR